MNESSTDIMKEIYKSLEQIKDMKEDKFREECIVFEGESFQDLILDIKDGHCILPLLLGRLAAVGRLFAVIASISYEPDKVEIQAMSLLRSIIRGTPQEDEIANEQMYIETRGLFKP